MGRGLTRERVIDLAAELVDTEGAQALSITRLAECCQVRAPSLYKHVADLDDVRTALVLRAYEAIADVLHGISASDPSEAVLALARAWRAWAKAHPGVYALASRTHMRGNAAVFTHGARVVSAVLERVRALGLRDDEAVHLARGVRSLVHGFALLEQADGFGLATDVDQSFDAAIRSLIAGRGA